MTEQQLTKQIIQHAKQQANALVAAAESQARNEISAAEQAAAKRQTDAIAKAQAALALAQTERERAQAVTQIKNNINAKQALLDQIFNQVRDHWYHATATQIQALAATLIAKYAQPNDTITVASDWHTALPNYPTTTAIQHGLIIANPTYRWELTIDGLIAALREELALPVAQKLGVM